MKLEWGDATWCKYWVVATEIFFMFTPEAWGRFPIWLSHIFQMGWFNHQPEYIWRISPEKWCLVWGWCHISWFHTPCFHGFLQRETAEPRLSFNFGSHPFCYDLAELPTLKVGSMGDRVERLLRWKKRASQRWRSWDNVIFIHYIYGIYLFLLFDITWYDIS